jgi:filamin
VSYTVAEAGEYKVSVRFDDQHIAGSPYTVYISPQLGDAKKVEIGQFPDSVTTLGKPVAFIVSTNGAKGQLDCKV